MGYVTPAKLGIFKAKQDEYNKTVFAEIEHGHTSEDIVAMEGYAKPTSTSAITENDTLNQAIGKLEKAIENTKSSIPLVTDTYSATSSNAMSGKAVASALSTIKVESATTAEMANALASTATIAGTQVTGTVANATTAGMANALASTATVAGTQVTGTVANATTAGTANALASTATVLGSQVSGEVASATTADSATTATKLGTTTVGGTTTPIYLNNGVPTELSYTIAKSVPSDAVFTDTVTTASTTGSGNAVTAISATDGVLTVTKGSTFLKNSNDSFKGALIFKDTTTDTKVGVITPSINTQGESDVCQLKIQTYAEANQTVLADSGITLSYEKVLLNKAPTSTSNDNQIATTEWVNTKLSSVVKSVNNIAPVSGNVTIPNFQGCTVNQPAVAGLVPSAPPATDAVLGSDGQWKAIASRDDVLALFN